MAKQNHFVRKLSSTLNPRPCRCLALLRASGLAAVILLGGLLPDTVSLAAGSTAETLPDVSLAPPQRLASARDAVKRGDVAMALHEYQLSIDEDLSTASVAITELVDLYLRVARDHNSGQRYVEESRWIMDCYRRLLDLRQRDAAIPLPLPVRTTLFQQIERVRQVGHDVARSHILSADELRCKAKGRWDDNEWYQSESLRLILMAWRYHPTFTAEWMVAKMHEIHDDMKSELPTWRYKQVMEAARGHGGSEYPGGR